MIEDSAAECARVPHVSTSALARFPFILSKLFILTYLIPHAINFILIAEMTDESTPPYLESKGINACLVGLRLFLKRIEKRVVCVPQIIV